MEPGSQFMKSCRDTKLEYFLYERTDHFIDKMKLCMTNMVRIPKGCCLRNWYVTI